MTKHGYKAPKIDRCAFCKLICDFIIVMVSDIDEKLTLDWDWEIGTFFLHNELYLYIKSFSYEYNATENFKGKTLSLKSFRQMKYDL